MFEVYMLLPVTAHCDLFAADGRRFVVAEPNLNELLCDPMTVALMAADHVDRNDFNAMLTQLRSRLR